LWSAFCLEEAAVKLHSCEINCTFAIRDLLELSTEMTTQVFGIMGMFESGLTRDASGTNKFSQRLLHSYHAFVPACLNKRTKLMVISATNEIADCTRCEHDLDGGVAPNLGRRGDEPLRDNCE